MKGRPQILAGLLGLALATQTALAAENPVVVQLNQRLAALQADPDLAELAAYEKLQAQHAVAAFSKARTWVLRITVRSRPMRMARQPMAGFSSCTERVR